MKLFKRMEAIVETETAKLWREYREILGRDSAKDAPRLAELLQPLGLTEKHVLFHRAVRLEAKMMAADVALLPQARADSEAAEKKTRELLIAHNEALIAYGLACQAEPALRRRVITLAERESDLAHLHRRFPELLGETKAVSEFPDTPPAALRNMAASLGLPKLAF